MSHRMLVVIGLTMISGCEKPTLPLPSAPAVPAAVKTPEAIRVVKVDHFSSPNGLRVERTLRGVWTGPLDHDDVERTVKNLYEAYRVEIDRDFPDAKDKWISLSLTADEASEAMSDQFVVINTGLVRDLPPWPPRDVKIDRRDEATRLTAEEVAIVVEYKQKNALSHEIADRPFRDEKGNLKSVAREKLIAAELSRHEMMKAFEDEIAAKHGLSRREYDRVFAKFFAWSSGLAATPDVIDKWANEGSAPAN